MLRLHFFYSLLFLFFGIFPVARGQYGYGGGNGGGNGNGGSGDGGGGHDNDGDTSTGASSPSTGSTPPSAGNAGNGTSASGSQGDTQCPGSKLMCVTGTVNGGTVTYELQSTGSQQLGWMAIGFGSTMANSPMVIMWPNADGTITLSQRQAPSEVMPTPVASPPNLATPAPSLSTLTGSQPKLAFTIAGSAKQESLIWAFGTTKPAAAADSNLEQHLDSGAFSLDLTKALSSSGSGAGGVPPSAGGSPHIPLLPYQKMIVAHAIVVTFGFLFLLPGGVLLARYTRTFSSRWFTGHWVLQAGIGGLFVIGGIILGFIAVNQHGTYIPSTHKTLGKVLLGAYLAQCFLGAFIHYVKIPFRFGRPPQNYIHAIFGLSVIGLALYQVRLGYSKEWPSTTGRGSLGNGVNIVWVVWTCLLALLYTVGLAYLPRQWRQERQGREVKQPEDYRLMSRQRQNSNDQLLNENWRT